jgi:ribA/ribD-fused uncharacterized protein
LVAEMGQLPEYKQWIKKYNSNAEYYHFPVYDANAFSSDEMLQKAATLIEACVSQNKKVQINCLGGHGRSGLLATVWLAQHHKLCFADALKLNNKLHMARTHKPKAGLELVQKKQASRIIDNVILFSRGYLSQFQKCKFSDPELGLNFDCAEQYMMARKALLFEDGKIFEQIIDNGKTPRMCKDLGKQVKNFDEKVWNQHKLNIVERGNFLKFSQNSKLAKQLLETWPCELAEAAWYDSIYGIGLNETQAYTTPKHKWPGQNLLGKCLVKVRDSLREKSKKRKYELALTDEPSAKRQRMDEDKK